MGAIPGKSQFFCSRDERNEESGEGGGGGCSRYDIRKEEILPADLEVSRIINPYVVIA